MVNTIAHNNIERIKSLPTIEEIEKLVKPLIEQKAKPEFEPTGNDEYELMRMGAKDTVKVLKYLKDTGVEMELPTRTEMKNYVALGYGAIIRHKKTRKYAGVALTFETEGYNVFAFFHVQEELRRKPVVGSMFKAIIKSLNKEKPMLIESRDIHTFKNCVVPSELGENLYEWKKGWSKWAG